MLLPNKCDIIQNMDSYKRLYYMAMTGWILSLVVVMVVSLCRPEIREYLGWHDECVMRGYK